MGERPRAVALAPGYALRAWWGSEAQIDWYEAYAELGEECQKVQVFSMRSMANRLTDRAHIIETGTESYRFRRTSAARQRGKKC